VLGELVQTTAGKWITHPPTRCPNGHSLGPNEVLVGHPGLPRSRTAATPPGLPHMRPDRVRSRRSTPTARLWTGPRPCVFPTSVTRNEIMSIPPEVELRLSGDLFGGNPRGLLAHLGLYRRPMGDNRWMVRPNEKSRSSEASTLRTKQVRPVRASILEILPIPRPTPGCANGCRGRHALPRQSRRQRLSRGSRVHPRMGRSYVMGQYPRKPARRRPLPPAPAPSGCSRGRRYWSAGSTAPGVAHAAPRCGSPTTSTAGCASTPES
jgi:hypothetical protein